MNSTTLSRRGFIQVSGSLVVTFSLAPLASQLAAQTTGGTLSKSVALDAVDGFVALQSDGTVRIYSGKVDLGTGLQTAITQIAAEELDVPFANVQVIQGDTLLTPDQGPTFGSLSIQVGGMQIRQACATARASLVASAAKKLGVEPSQVLTENGVCIANGQRITYVDLLGETELNIKLNPQAPLKNPSKYAIVGKSLARLDIPAKLTGEFEYMQDFRLPGMLHARVIRPSAINANLLSVNDSAARKIPGYIQTVRKNNFLAVVAKNEWAAIQASNAVKATWSNWEGLPDSNKLWEYVRNSKVSSNESLQKIGDSAAALKNASKVMKATYDFAIHTHGSIGPSCAVAEYKDGKVTCWNASQQTHMLRKQLAQMLQLPEADIRCIYIEGAGCYGRNGHEDAAADAVLIAKEIGKPVRVQWMRADEHGWDPKGPPTLLDYRATLDEKGNIAAWESEVFIPERPKQASVTLIAAELANLPKEPPNPGGIHQSLAIQYKVPNVQATAHWLAETPFRPSWIRTPGRMQNTFGNETFIDELAVAANADPLEFRLRHLDDKRGAECIERASRLAAWRPAVSHSGNSKIQGDIVRGRGVSYIKYELVRTYVTVVADVEVNRKTGKVRVLKFYVAHDCGQIINPDGLRNQLEGNVIQTVSRTLIEELQYDRSRVTSVDWASYPILTFPEVPEVVMDLIDRPNEKPWGAGEPTAAVVPSAISNAIYDAAGIRLRSVPFTPAKVLAALEAKQRA